MGIELIIIGIIAGASVLISGISATVSIGTIFHFTKKFKSVVKTESKDTTNVIIKNEAIKQDNADGSSKTIRKQEIDIYNVDMDIGSKLIAGSTSLTRTGLPNETAEILAKGGVGALNKLAAEVLPQITTLADGVSKVGTGLAVVKGVMKSIETQPESAEHKVKNAVMLPQKEAISESDSVDTMEPSKKPQEIAYSSDVHEACAAEEVHISAILTPLAGGTLNEEGADVTLMSIESQGVLGDIA